MENTPFTELLTRVGRLEGRVDSQESWLSRIEASVASGFDKLSKKLDDLSSEVQTGRGAYSTITLLAGGSGGVILAMTLHAIFPSIH